MAQKNETWGYVLASGSRAYYAVREEDSSRAIRWQQASVAYRCLYFEVVTRDTMPVVLACSTCSCHDSV